MNDLLLYGIILGIWFILQLWVFPKLGIPTCMSGSCGIPRASDKTNQEVDKYKGQVDLVNKESKP